MVPAAAKLAQPAIGSLKLQTGAAGIGQQAQNTRQAAGHQQLLCRQTDRRTCQQTLELSLETFIFPCTGTCHDPSTTKYLPYACNQLGLENLGQMCSASSARCRCVQPGWEVVVPLWGRMRFHTKPLHVLLITGVFTCVLSSGRYAREVVSVSECRDANSRSTSGCKWYCTAARKRASVGCRTVVKVVEGCQGSAR